MPLRNIQIVIQIVYVHLSVTETSSRGNVEISHDFINAKSAFYAAALAPLLVEFLRIVFSLALLDVLTATKRPTDGGISFAHFFAGVTAAGFGGFWRRWGAVAVPAIARVEM